MSWTLVIAVAAIILTGYEAAETITKCEYDKVSCGCKTDKGLINLKHFETSGLSTASTPGGGMFYWNPCKDFSMGKITAACVQHIARNLDYDCGSHDSSTSSVDGGHALFQMQSKDFMRQSKVKCICGSDEKLKFISESPTTVYNMELNSVHCCPGNQDGGGGSSGLSGGSILLILFFCLVFVYLVGGTLYMTGVKKAQGKERIPNVEFWQAVPGLIGAGFKFTFSCGKSAGYGQI